MSRAHGRPFIQVRIGLDLTRSPGPKPQMNLKNPKNPGRKI